MSWGIDTIKETRVCVLDNVHGSVFTNIIPSLAIDEIKDALDNLKSFDGELSRSVFRMMTTESLSNPERLKMFRTYGYNDGLNKDTDPNTRKISLGVDEVFLHRGIKYGLLNSTLPSLRNRRIGFITCVVSETAVTTIGSDMKLILPEFQMKENDTDAVFEIDAGDFGCYLKLRKPEGPDRECFRFLPAGVYKASLGKDGVRILEQLL